MPDATPQDAVPERSTLTIWVDRFGDPCGSARHDARKINVGALEAEVERLREDYRLLLCAHPAAQEAALTAYLSSYVDGKRDIDAARRSLDA